jgi:hypothetical protein
MILTASSAFSAEPYMRLDLSRTRTSASIVKWSVSIRIQVDLTELSLGENSQAVLSPPINNTSQITAASTRTGRATFNFSFDFNDPAELNGVWICVFNDGTTPDEDIRYSLTGLDASKFPEYRLFPEIEYQGAYNKVYFSTASTDGLGTGGILSGPVESEPTTDGRIYTFPQGGPHYIGASSTTALPKVSVFNRDNEVWCISDWIFTSTISRVDFFVNQSPLPFKASVARKANSTNILCQGMRKAREYRIFYSLDLKSWSLIEEFTSESNGLFYKMNSEANSGFFKIEEVEQDAP